MDVYQFKPHMIYQTVAEIETELSHWIDWLYARRGTSIGHDPRPVFRLEQDLTALSQRLDRLDLQFDLLETGHRLIHSVQSRFNLAVERIRAIRRAGRGSPKYTYQILHLLQDCLLYVRSIRNWD